MNRKLHTEETKRKISEALKGRPGYWKGKSLTKGAKEKLSRCNKGKKLSKEIKKKMSISRKGRIVSEGTRKKISEANKGRIASEETKKKISNSLKGVPLSEEQKKKIGKANKGRILSLKSRKNMSEAAKNKPIESHSNWRGGLSFEVYGFDFNDKLRQEIKIRDNYICQECGSKPKSHLAVHHIDYDKRNNKKDNLISLCIHCHIKTNYERGDWIKHYQFFIKNKKGVK